MFSATRDWLLRLENQPLTRRNRVGALVALLTCPCHLGVAIILLSGTAVGGWLASQRAWLYMLFTAAFATGLVTLFRRVPQTCNRGR
jgi:cobalamin biosynthesis protein CobD/CbiB